jgi:hypothetical protein
LVLDTKDLFQVSSLDRNDIYTEQCVSGNQIHKFFIGENYFIPKSLEGIDYKEDAFLGNKLLLKRISPKIEGTFDSGKLFAFNTVYSLYNEKLDKKSLLFILGVLNSKLMNYYYEKSYNLGMNLTTQVTIEFLSKLPIKNFSLNDKLIIAETVDKILKLNKELQKISENSNKWNSIKSEIEKTDKKIDEEVYKLYGLKPEEIKIVET